MIRLILLSISLLLAASGQAQSNRYVATTGSDVGDCTAETNPCATIAYALDQSSANDAIEIADGVYTGMLDITKDIALHGESEGGTFIQAGDGRVITIDGEFEVEITDLTVRNGHATGNAPESFGGGIFNNGATMSLNNVTFSGNEAGWGGGMYNTGATLILTSVTFTENQAGASGAGMYNEDSSPELEDVTFTDNQTFSLDGAGMYNDNSPATLVNVTFQSNLAFEWGGGMYNSGSESPSLTNVTFSGNGAGSGGGGMFNRDSSPTLTNVTFSGNDGTTEGGGLYIWSGTPTLTNVQFEHNRAGSGGGIYNQSAPTLSNVTFHENDASFGGGMMCSGGSSSPMLTDVIFSGNSALDGGGMYIGSGSPSLVNATFSGNVANDEGGGMYNWGDSPSLTNVTFSGNSAGQSGGGIYNQISSFPVLSNVIIWNNEANGDSKSASASIFTVESDPEISYSLIANSGGSGSWNPDIGTDLGNNIDADPLFLEPIELDEAPTILGNFRLTHGSPAIDSGDPDTNPLIFPTDGMGEPIDLDGNPRFMGDGIEMGPYEWEPVIDAIFADRFEVDE